jgi:hypothetical protein
MSRQGTSLVHIEHVENLCENDFIFENNKKMGNNF